MTGLLLAGGLLVLLLLAARARDIERSATVANAWSETLTPNNRELLDRLTLTIGEHRVGVDACRRALGARDAARFRRAVTIVEDFAPGLRSGLEAMRTVGRAASTLVPLPAVRPLAWRAWQLRTLTGLVVVLHAALVAATERMRLRVWLLGRALAFCLRRLRCSSRRVAQDDREWGPVARTIDDLAMVGNEAALTYHHVVHALDSIARLAPA